MFKVYDIHHFTSIPFDKMIDNGAKGFIIRSAIGGETDVKRDKHIATCIEKCVPFGLYYYFNARDKNGIALTDRTKVLNELKRQARIYCNDIKKVWNKYSKTFLTLGVYLDIEELNIYDLGKETLTTFVLNFVNLMNVNNVPIRLYGNPDFFENRVNKTKLSGVPIWLADWRYKEKCTTLSNYNGIAWQYGCDDINGLKVDGNYFYTDEINKYFKE